MKDQPYDPLKDFTPVGDDRLHAAGARACIRACRRRRSKEFIALAKSKPGSLNFASLGPSTTQGLAAYLFNQDGRHRGGARCRTRAARRARRTSSPATCSTCSTRCPRCCGTSRRASCARSASRARSARRSCPTCPPSRRRVPGYEVTTWYSFVAPAGHARSDVVERLNREISAIVESAGDEEEAAPTAGLEADAMTRRASSAKLLRTRPQVGQGDQGREGDAAVKRRNALSA